MTVLPVQLLREGYVYRRADDGKKYGAGLLFVTPHHVLLLKRSKWVGHPKTWGLVGGQLQADETPWAGAQREAYEEIGPLPPLTQQAHFLRDTPAHHFDVFLVAVPSLTRREWCPQLNDEHTKWRWFPRHELPGKLHPVVAWLVQRGHL